MLAIDGWFLNCFHSFYDTLLSVSVSLYWRICLILYLTVAISCFFACTQYKDTHQSYLFRLSHLLTWPHRSITNSLLFIFLFDSRKGKYESRRVLINLRNSIFKLHTGKSLYKLLLFEEDIQLFLWNNIKAANFSSFLTIHLFILTADKSIKLNLITILNRHC